MCNRYRQVKTREDLSRIFDARLLDDLPQPAAELFPKRLAPVIRRGEAGERVVDVMAWGFPPPPKSRAPVTNVRNLASPFWRSALARPDRRCLVPVTEFCEWSGEKGAKTEHWFALRDGAVFAFAGVWRPIEPGRAFAFLTCEPNPLVAPIHEKAMPVILHPEDYDRWLDSETADACALAEPFPSQLMQVA
ncbi:MAG TPA: SOS response-associated peptidase family protein [Allosphingosinicella sp.]|jgi:putative SOS response-associated peptidase YedK|nr:SOS response-associated peptidase family protein [Allosphingosinicella sp.]